MYSSREEILRLKKALLEERIARRSAEAELFRVENELRKIRGEMIDMNKSQLLPKVNRSSGKRSFIYDRS